MFNVNPIQNDGMVSMLESRLSSNSALTWPGTVALLL